jgi:hypothetical protein
VAVSLFIGPQGLVFKRAPGPKHPAFEALCRRDPGVLFGLLVGRDYFKVESFLAEDPPDPADLGQAFCIVHPVITGGLIRQVTENPTQTNAIVVDAQGALLFSEPLQVFLPNHAGHANPIGPAQTLDFLQITRHLHGQKARPLAVFTNVYNEGPMLQAWETHYSKYLDQLDLYVVDDGSTDGSINLLNRSTQVVRLPKGQFDLWTMSNFCSYFQRFLLTKYQWVVHVDCDELLIAKDGFGSKDFLNRLQPNTIYQCDEALLVVQEHDKESEFDFGFKTPLTQQRSRFGLEIRGFLKPVLADVPVTWGPGYHFCIEPAQFLEDFWLIHLKYVDFNRLCYRHQHWAAMASSSLTDAYYWHVKELRESKAVGEIEMAVEKDIQHVWPETPFELPDWVRQEI